MDSEVPRRPNLTALLLMRKVVVKQVVFGLIESSLFVQGFSIDLPIQ